MIYGPVCENGVWRIRHNAEIDFVILRYVKSLRLVWLRHEERMEDIRTPKTLLHDNSIGIKRKGKPRRRWQQDVEQDMRELRIRSWRKLAQQWEEWKMGGKETKAEKSSRAEE
ncbi:hypothetical protein C0J52_14635 [Blattella germanica]|nr:hypothetical protein C0J52_14635 [Blattella germanica]